MLVEDDPNLAAGLTWGLIGQGHQVHHTELGRPVIGLIWLYRPDAVILDLSLPDLDGEVLGRMVRRTWPELPIIFATGHDVAARQRLAGSDPMTAYLQKPFSLETIDALLRELAGKLRK